MSKPILGVVSVFAVLVFLAAMFIASIVPIGAFLIFQRSFLRSSGLGGAVKG